MTTPDIARIAEGLTKAERDAVLGVYSFSGPTEEDASEAKLYRLGLWKSYRIHSGETHWTPLGADVAAYLKEQAILNPGPFMALLGKVLPMQIDANLSHGVTSDLAALMEAVNGSTRTK